MPAAVADMRSYIYMLIAATGVLWLLSTGFVFWPEPQAAASLNQISREGFSGVCHQFSWRSFGSGDHTMAVCSRCFGIYSGFFMASLAGLTLLLYPLPLRLSHAGWLLAGAVLLNGADVAGNALGWWTNTLYSRFFLGFGIGAGLILLIFSLLPTREPA